MKPPFRVLSLSGGGMRGVFSAAVLCELQEALQNHTKDENARLVDHFDLIVGTSTGGLLGLGLGFGRSPEALLGVYKSKGRRIFPPAWANWRWLRGGPLIFPFFSTSRLREVVEAMVPPDKTLGQSACPLVLTAVRRESGEVTCLKTKHDDSFYRDHLMSAVEAGLATSAAPVAFPRVRTEKHGDLLDGGLWANSPILIGIIEACRYFKQQLSDVRVLSIGTTRTRLPRRSWWHLGGVLEYGGLLRGRLQDHLWEGQRSLAIQAANLMLPPGALIHIDHEFAGRGYSLMDSSLQAIRALEQAGREEGQKNAKGVCESFFAAGRTQRDPPVRRE